MLRLVLILFAAFWVWETFRALVEQFAPRLFALARPVHPLLAALLPLYVLWPDWVAALAVAGVVGLLVAWVDRLFGVSQPAPVQIPRRNRAGLPPLP